VNGSFVVVLEIEVAAKVMDYLLAFICAKRYNRKKGTVSTLHHTG
jgi:hypothetical protein